MKIVKKALLCLFTATLVAPLPVKASNDEQKQLLQQIVTVAIPDNTAHHNFTLGLIYYLGHNQPKNLLLARHYFARAAEQGHIKAQFNTGLMHQQGMGGPKSFQRARHYYILAANQGNAAAQHNLALMYYAEQNIEQALFYYEQAAAQQFAPTLALYKRLNDHLKEIRRCRGTFKSCGLAARKK